MGTSINIQDVIPFVSNRTNPKKVDTDTILPFIILPLLLLIATISSTVSIVVFIMVGMGVLYVLSRPRQKNRSPFFLSWTLSSATFMFLVFEFVVQKFLEITRLENFIFLSLLACTYYFFHKMKAIADFELTGASKGKEYSPVLTSDSHYCQICQIEVNDRYFHSIWWDCCVFRPNYPYFIAAQVFAFASLLVGTNLGLTTICRPFIFYFNILLPEDCTDVYQEFNTSLCFVTCVYGIGYMFVIGLVLIHQLLVQVPRYAEPQWRRVVKVFSV